MSIDIGDALSRGFDDLTSRRGATVYGLYAIFGIFSAITYMTLMRYFFGVYLDWAVQTTDLTREELLGGATLAETFPLALDIPLPVASVLGLVVWVLSIIIAIVAIRTFASESSEPIPVGEVTRRLGWTFVVYLITMVLAGILISIGFVLLFVPGIVLAFLLAFAQFAVAIDDAGPIEALKKSYGIVTDDPIEVLVLLVAIMALAFVVVLALSLVPLPPLAAAIASNLIVLAVSVFSLATLTDAYLQATGQRGTSPDTGF